MQFSTQTTARTNSTQPRNARKPQFFLPIVIREKKTKHQLQSTGIYF